MINRRLDGVLDAGEEKRYCSMLTAEEEVSLVLYIKNRSRCLQWLNQKQVEAVMLTILKSRKTINKKGGHNFQELIRSRKDCC